MQSQDKKSAGLRRFSRSLLGLTAGLAVTLELACSPKPAFAATEAAPAFKVAPYLQLGNHPKYGKKDNFQLLWISDSICSKWQVEERKNESPKWSPAGVVKHRQIGKDENANEFLFTCELSNLPAGKNFAYRVTRDDKIVFESTGLARKSKDAPYSFDVFGDFGANSPGQKQIANLCFNQKPDFVVMPGDLVYPSGRYCEYLTNYFPIYNAEKQSSDGVPLLRSTLTIGVVGNHDVASGHHSGPVNLDKMPDTLAYFYLWSEPLNGPNIRSHAPTLHGSDEHLQNFKTAAGTNYPNMTNYSFDYGNSHWLVLDGNAYTDWSAPELRKWVESDLHNAKKATWKFVTFHQPAFCTDAMHPTEQRMRLLVDIFEKEHVDIAFTGHAHDYQRSYPVHFAPALKDGRAFIKSDGTVDGTIQIDKDYDGSTKTRPNGIIYLVSGAGGAALYREIPDALSGKFEEFTFKCDLRHYSLSSCHVEGKRFEMKQIAEDGTVLDQFTVTK